MCKKSCLLQPHGSRVTKEIEVLGVTVHLGLNPSKETLTKPSWNKDHAPQRAFYCLPRCYIPLWTTTIQSCSQTGLCFLLRLLRRSTKVTTQNLCLHHRVTILELQGKNCRTCSELLLPQRDSSEQVSKMAALTQCSDSCQWAKPGLLGLSVWKHMYLRKSDDWLKIQQSEK